MLGHIIIILQEVRGTSTQSDGARKSVIVGKEG